MTNELAASLIEIAWTYRHAGKSLPPHVVADLLDVARADSIANRLRVDAARLIERAIVEENQA